MSLDEALMSRARRTGETVLRVYTWSRPTLSLGRNQRAAGAYDADRIREASYDVVRRPTGGRALIHCREITYSVTGPSTATLGAEYASINALLANALRALGVPADVAAPASPGLPPSSTPCFAEPSAGELTAGGRKLVGSAQWRDAGAMLQHGSILVDDDQGTLAALMRVPPDRVPPPATLRALLGRAPSAEEVAGHLLDAIRALADAGAERLDAEPEVTVEARRLAGRYRDAAWTWRR